MEGNADCSAILDNTYYWRVVVNTSHKLYCNKVLRLKVFALIYLFGILPILFAKANSNALEG